jgi:nucleoid DNA-binding protein
MPDKKPGAKAPTKAEIYTNIATATGLSKKEVSTVLEALAKEIESAVSKKGPGQFNLLGLMKVVRVYKEATKKRQVRNPATGEMVWAEPKPARNVVKVRPLKQLKDLVL